MLVKIHKRQTETIVAICDRELMGKILREGEVVINLEKYGGFYRGERVAKKEAIEAVRSCTSANFVGKKAAEIAVLAGIARKKDFRFVDGIPHLQFYKIKA
ncbi:MAG: DUF424 family protein [Candidatus Micrarchaeota archaeon]|nr:DUF424 family protein [Candidatus Micrarchaeota archaeon]